MNNSYLCAAIVFIVVGLMYSGFGIYLSLTGKEKKDAFTNTSGKFFSLIGALSAISGILGIIFMEYLTQKAILISAVIFLAAMTALLSIYTFSMHQDNSSDK